MIAMIKNQKIKIFLFILNHSVKSITYNIEIYYKHYLLYIIFVLNLFFFLYTIYYFDLMLSIACIFVKTFL